MELSYEAKQSIVQAALTRRYPDDANTMSVGTWLRRLYSDHVVFMREGKMLQAAYTIEGQEATLGEPSECADAEVATQVSMNASEISSDAPEWIELMPSSGYVVGRDGRSFLIKNPAAIIAASKVRADNDNNKTVDLPIDYDHQTFLAAVAGVGGTAPAAGWIKTEALEVRDGKIGAKVEWTPRGKTALASKEYRYISPAFDHDTKTKEVLCIRGAGLTGNPNFRLAALASEQPQQQGATMNELLKKLAAALGLSADSGEETVLAHAKSLVAKCTAQATAIATMAAAAGAQANASVDAVVTAVQSAITSPDAAKFVPASVVTSLQSEVAVLKRKDVERLVDDVIANQKKLAPAQREWAIGYCSSDPVKFAEFVEKQPAIFGQDLGRRSRGGDNGALGEEDLALCASMGISEDEFKKQREKEAK